MVWALISHHVPFSLAADLKDWFAAYNYLLTINNNKKKGKDSIMRKSYFVSCMIDTDYTLFETVNLGGTLKKLFAWANDGIRVSNLTIKPTRVYERA